MATIRLRRSTTSGAAPSGLEAGEPAVNLADGRLYIGDGSGNIVIPQLTTYQAAPSTDIQLATSNQWYTAATITAVPAGTYIVLAQIQFWKNATTARVYAGRVLVDGSAALGGSAYVASANPSGTVITLIGVVTLPSAADIALQGMTTVGATTDTIRVASPHVAGVPGTIIHVVRVR